MSLAHRWARPLVVVFSATLAYAFVAAYFSLRKHDNFLSGFDLANFDQGLWLLSHGYEPLITQHGRLFWGDHFTPTVIGLLTPLYALGAGPKTLLVVQALTMASVAPLLYALARAFGARPWPSTLPAVLWLASPLTLIPNVQDFHHVPFVAPAIVGSILALRHDRLVVFAALAVLAMGAKEDVPLIYVMLGLVVALEGRRRLGLAISASALAVFLFATQVFVPHFSNSLDWFEKRFAGDRGDSLADVARWMLTHPAAALGDLLTAQNVLVVAALIVASGGLCLLAPRWMLLGLPALAHNLLSAHAPQHQLDVQYVVPVALSFAIAGAAGVQRLRSDARRMRLFATAGVTLALLVFPLGLGHVHVFSAWRSQTVGNAGETAARREALALIPSDARVAASVRLTPHLSQREEIYSLPLPFIWVDYGSDWSRAEIAKRVSRVEWVALDLSERPPELPRAAELLPPVIERAGFRLLRQFGNVRIYKRPA